MLSTDKLPRYIADAFRVLGPELRTDRQLREYIALNYEPDIASTDFIESRIHAARSVLNWRATR